MLHTSECFLIFFSFDFVKKFNFDPDTESDTESDPESPAKSDPDPELPINSDPEKSFQIQQTEQLQV